MRFPWRLPAAGAVTVLLATGLGVAAPGTACACSCASFATPEEAVSHASGVFVARATDVASGGFTDTYQFAVSEVFKGDVGPTTTVGTLSDGNGCGTGFEVGREYLLFVSRPYDVSAAWEAYSCGPYTGTSFDVRAATERVYGAARAPSADGPVHRITPWTRMTAAVPLPLLAVGAAAAVGLSWWVVSAIRRRRRATD